MTYPFSQPQLPFAGPDPLGAPPSAAPPVPDVAAQTGGAPGTGGAASPEAASPVAADITLPGVGELAVHDVTDPAGQTRHQLVLVVGHDVVQAAEDAAKAVVSHVRGIPLGFIEDAAAFGLQALTRLL